MAAVMLLGAGRVRKASLPLGVAAQLLSCLLYALCAFTDMGHPFMLVVGGALGSLSAAVLSALWIDLYARFNPVRAVWCGSVAMIIAQLIVFLIEDNTAQRLFVALVVASLFSAATYIVSIRSADAVTHGDYAAEGGKRFVLPYKALLFIGAYSFAYGFALMRDDLLNMRYASVVPCLIAVAFLLINDRKFNVSALIRVAFPLMVSGFLLVFFVAGAGSPFAVFVINAGFATMEILLMFMVCTISYSVGTSAIWLFGAFLGVQSFARLLGAWTGGFLSECIDASFRHEIIGVVAIALVIIASVVLMSEKSLFSFWRFRAASEGGDPGSDSVRMRIGNLADLYNLTDREKEVFYLLAQGKSNMEIAHDMIISEGTVKAHLHHMYRKFGVHRRQDLLEFIKRD